MVIQCAINAINCLILERKCYRSNHPDLFNPRRVGIAVLYAELALVGTHYLVQCRVAGGGKLIGSLLGVLYGLFHHLGLH